jgi:uncharacterized protein (TIGR03032 family)
MSRPHPDDRFARHDRAWRHPGQVVAGAEELGAPDDRLLRARVRGGFWDLLEQLDLTLLVTREYEHLAVGLTSRDGRPWVTALCLPHPSGIAVDQRRGRVHVAATRNPNQIVELAPAQREEKPPLPVRSTFYPGSFYLHDLAFVGDVLHGNAVGRNAVVRLDGESEFDPVWWPAAIETRGRPDFTTNYLQLNSIAGGPSLERSYFTASTDSVAARRPGHRNFPVDGRGVLYSGAAREPIARGLTRPHSARLHRRRVWIDDSGYGRLVVLRGEEFETVAELPGWTRGLCFAGDVAFVGTSRVLPRFRSYAPGLDLDRSRCGIHAVDLRTGTVLASYVWPEGDQIFAVEAVRRRFALGFPFGAGRGRSRTQARDLFYDYELKRRR